MKVLGLGRLLGAGAVVGILTALLVSAQPLVPAQRDPLFLSSGAESPSHGFVGITDDRVLETRMKKNPFVSLEIPSLEELEREIEKTKSEMGAHDWTSVFWTGDSPNKPVMMDFIANELGGEGIWWEDFFDEHWRDKFELGKEDAIRWQPVGRSSEAFARNSRGVVYLLMPSDKSPTDPYEKRVANWVAHEYNTLTRNPRVTSIVRVNLADFKDTSELWNKNSGLVYGRRSVTDGPRVQRSETRHWDLHPDDGT